MVLVVGSAGKLGSAIVWRLRKDGVPVRALVRRTSNTTVLAGSEAELVVGDLRDPESLRIACRGCGAGGTTASSLHSSTGLDFQRGGRQGDLSLIEWAKGRRAGPVDFHL